MLERQESGRSLREGSVEIPDAAVEKALDSLEEQGLIGWEHVRAALMAARPYLMPTREQIAEAVYLSESSSNAHRPEWSDAAPGVRALFYDIADAVLGLLNGPES